MRPNFFGIPSSGGRAYALEFDGTPKHVNYGMFWQPNVAYSDCFAEFMVKPTGSGYFLSAGYGGNHCLLIGVDGTDAGWIITGNVHNSDTSTSTTFTTVETLRHNEWHYVSVAIDGINIIVSINGVPSSFVAFDTDRKTTDPVEGVLFVGGSGHLNFSGRLAGVRIFENGIPVSSANFFKTNCFRPPTERFTQSGAWNGTAMVSPSFIADFRTGRLDDQSLGLDGVKHNGFLAEASLSETETGLFYNNGAYNRDISLLPKWVQDEFAFPTTAPTAQTPIVGARIYDDFSRADVHLGTSATLGLGTTTVGNKTWSGSHYGILNGLAFPKAADGLSTFVTDNQVNCTIIMRRPYSVTNAGAGWQLVFRGTSDDDCEKLDIADTGTSYILQYVGGVYQGAIGGSFNFGTDWLEAKVVLTGDQCQIYKNGTLIATKTMTANLSGTGAGFNLPRCLYRISEFAVI